MGHCDLGTFICVNSPDVQTIRLGEIASDIPSDYFQDKYLAAEGVSIQSRFLFHQLLWRSKRTLGPAIRKICIYHDRFDNWPSESLMLRCVLEQLWWGRGWSKIMDTLRRLI